MVGDLVYTYSMFDKFFPKKPTKDKIETEINKALISIEEPISGLNIIQSGLISDISLKEGNLRIIIEKPANYQADLEAIQRQIERRIVKIDDINKVSFLITAHTPEQAQMQPKPPRPSANTNSIRPPHIGKLIAVASGKGGVGKSTIAFNLALALARLGKKVGILDADIYGPSIPTLMGLAESKCETGEDNRIIPLKAHGIKAMSMGFTVEKDQALAWRGPMVSKALTQLFQGVNWGELDFLILDMPPGTGDVQLSLAQQARIDGAILVSTPQEIALADVRRGITMFQKSGVKILGIVENMSLLKDEQTGVEIDLFGRGGARIMALENNIPFIGEVYFYPSLQKSSNFGNAPPAIASEQFDAIARTVTM